MRPVEVAVVGAGIVGAAVARELAVRGVDVCLIDRGDVASATTGLGEGNVLAGDKDVGPELALTLAGLALYDELDERLGARARIRRKGSLVVHTQSGTWAAEPARLARLQAAGVTGELLEPDAVQAREPALLGPLHGAAFFPRDLQCDPCAIARALAADVPDVRRGTFVHAVSVERSGGGDALAPPGRGDGRRRAAPPGPLGRVVGLETSAGRMRAQAVVLAAGPWSAALAATAGLRLPLEPRKGQLVRLHGPPGAAPFLVHKVLDAAYLGSVTSPDAGLQVSTVMETTWDGDVLVGSSRERRGFDDRVDESVTDRMLARAAHLAPGLRALPRAAAWAGLRPWLPDHLPAIGASSDVPGLWLATGHEGAGVALGPITGRLVAQAYTGEPTTVDLAPFHPDRFAGRQVSPAPPDAARATAWATTSASRSRGTP